MSDLEVISLSITAEVLGIGSESLLFSILKTEYLSKFPHLIQRTNYNRRRRKLQPYISQVAQRVGQLIDPQPALYILDSIPLPICQPFRIPRCKINKNEPECLPSRGYHASHKQYYYGLKLQVMLTDRGVAAFNSLETCFGFLIRTTG